MNLSDRRFTQRQSRQICSILMRSAERTLDRSKFHICGATVLDLRVRINVMLTLRMVIASIPKMISETAPNGKRYGA